MKLRLGETLLILLITGVMIAVAVVITLVIPEAKGTIALKVSNSTCLQFDESQRWYSGNECYLIGESYSDFSDYLDWIG